MEILEIAEITEIAEKIKSVLLENAEKFKNNPEKLQEIYVAGHRGLDAIMEVIDELD